MAEATLEERMRAIEDRAAIVDVLGRYAFCIDRRRWDEFAQCFTEEIDVNSIRTGGWVRMASADLVRTVSRAFETYTATQHLSSNHIITLEGDTAVVWSTLNATHFLKDAVGDQYHQQVGYYEYHLMRGPQWRIYKFQQVVHWQRGNQRIFDSTLTLPET